MTHKLMGTHSSQPLILFQNTSKRLEPTPSSDHFHFSLQWPVCTHRPQSDGLQNTEQFLQDTAHFLVKNTDQVSILILRALHSVRPEDLTGPPPAAKTLDSLSYEASQVGLLQVQGLACDAASSLMSKGRSLLILGG